MLNLICRLCTASLLIVATTLSANALAEEQPKTIMVFVDLSDSTIKDREDYKGYFNMVLDSTNEGDRLILGSIEKNPQGKSIIRFNEILPVQNPYLDNSIKFNRKIRKILDSAQISFVSLANESSNETPIVDTIEEATRLFASYPNLRKILVLFSDMKEFSKGGLSFESHNLDLNESKANRLIADLKSKKKIANLSGVKIYVAGARDTNTKLRGQVRDFWTKYFKEAGADFSADRYGTDLLAFREQECPDCKERYSKKR